MNKKKQKSVSSNTKAATTSWSPETNPLSGSFPEPNIWMAVLLIIAVTVLAYSNSLNGAFVFDDKGDILENPSIRSLWPSWSDWRANLGRSRPVVNYSLAINYLISEYNVWSYHLLNLLIHILAALTLFGIVHRTLSWGKFRERYGRASTWLAFVCALIWVIHPVHTQAVTYVIQRCESLMGLCFLLTLYCAVRGWQSTDAKYLIYWHLGAIGACLLGVGSKEVIVVAPVMVLLYDLIFVSSGLKEALRRSRGLYAGLACCIILSVVIAVWAALIPKEFDIVGMGRIDRSDFNLVRSALVQTRVFFHYLRLSFWPNPLIFDYAWPFTITPGVFLYTLGFLVLIIGSVWTMWRRHPLAYAVVWYIVILAPTSVLAGIGALTPAAEHRLYLPLAGIIALAVMGVYEGSLALMNRFSLSGQQQTWWRRAGVISLVASIAVVFGTLTFLRNQDYQSEYAIWADTLQKTPQNPWALTSMGLVLANELDRPEAAIPYFQNAIRVKPGHALAHYSLGKALYSLGRPEAAISYFQTAIKIKPNDAKAHFDLGVALVNIGDIKRAVLHYQKALKINPDEPATHFNLGTAMLRLDRWQEAIPYFEKTLNMKPDLAEAHLNLGIALANTGRVEDGISHIEKALEFKPDLHLAQQTLQQLKELSKYQDSRFNYE